MPMSPVTSSPTQRLQCMLFGPDLSRVGIERSYEIHTTSFTGPMRRSTVSATIRFLVLEVR